MKVYAMRRAWWKIRWRLALLSDLVAFAILCVAFAGGIYVASIPQQAWPGVLLAIAAVVVLIAWGRAHASSHRCECWLCASKTSVRRS